MSAPDLLLVTAADSSHFRSLMQLLASVRRFEPQMRVSVVDLGLDLREAVLLAKRHPRYRLRKFDFASYPSHFDIRVNAGEYAWKPAIIWEELSSTQGPVCWMDAGNALVGDLGRLRKELSAKGFYSPYSPGTIAEWTHPSTLSYLGLDSAWSGNRRNLNGACIAFDPSRAEALRLAKEWRDCAFSLDCIAPAGSNKSNHRQDQAVLTVLAYKAGLVEGVDHSTLGYKIHQDVESNVPKAFARAAKRYLGYLAQRLRANHAKEGPAL